MSEIGNYILANELQNETKILKYGNYQSNRISPIVNNNNTSGSLITTSGTWLEYEVPSKCVNCSTFRADMNFCLTVATPFVHLFFNDGVSFIKSLQLVTRGGQYIVRIDEFDRYSKLFRYTTSKEKFRTLTNTANDSSLTGAGPTNSSLMKHRGLAHNADLSQGQRITAGATAGVNRTSDDEPTYFTSTGTMTDTVKLTYPLSLPLSLIKDSFFSVNRDVNFGEIVLLRIELNEPARVGFKTSIASDVALPGYWIENPYLYMGIQQNQAIIDMVNSNVRQDILIPFVRSSKLAGPNSSGVDYTLSNRINTSDGSHLVRIYVQPYNSTESDATAQDRCNKSLASATGVNTPAKWLYFHTEVDSIRRQPFDLLCTTYDDYELLRPLLVDSCVSDEQQFAQNQVWIENFGSNYPIASQDWTSYDTSKMIQGAPIEKEIKHDFVYRTTANNVQNYFHIVTLKVLSIDKNSGISVHS